mmetsp:Transcript_28154/g.82955  ORF Transcript_28154/g.82955 Transcript_28154/m.82955 type:complete len:269 (+) Transcript_28154:919-1725(+)
MMAWNRTMTHPQAWAVRGPASRSSTTRVTDPAFQKRMAPSPTLPQTRRVEGEVKIAEGASGRPAASFFQRPPLPCGIAPSPLARIAVAMIAAIATPAGTPAAPAASMDQTAAPPPVSALTATPSPRPSLQYPPSCSLGRTPASRWPRAPRPRGAVVDWAPGVACALSVDLTKDPPQGEGLGQTPSQAPPCSGRGWLRGRRGPRRTGDAPRTLTVAPSRTGGNPSRPALRRWRGGSSGRTAATSRRDTGAMGTGEITWRTGMPSSRWVP